MIKEERLPPKSPRESKYPGETPVRQGQEETPRLNPASSSIRV